MGRETVVVIVGVVVCGAWVENEEGDMWKLMVLFMLLMMVGQGEGEGEREVEASKRWPSDSSSLLRRRSDAAAMPGFLYFATAL